MVTEAAQFWSVLPVDFTSIILGCWKFLLFRVIVGMYEAEFDLSYPVAYGDWTIMVEAFVSIWD